MYLPDCPTRSVYSLGFRALTLGLAMGLVMVTSVSFAQRPSLVKVDEVIAESLVQTVDVIGKVVARQGGTVASRMAGVVVSVEPDVGSRVNLGDMIATINSDTVGMRYDVAASDLARAQATLGVREQSQTLARQERRRLQKLKNSASTSRAAFENAQQNEAIEAARVKEAIAAVDAAKASLRLAELDRTHAAIRAPYDGVVTRRFTEIGSYLKVGDPVVDMIADHNLEVQADVPFQYIAGLEPGAAFTVVLDDGSEHAATLRAIIPIEDSRTRTRPVRFKTTFTATTHPLAVGQSTTIKVPVSAARDIVSVHKDAIVRKGAKTIVYVVEQDTAKLKPVLLGNAVGNRFEVRSGLNAGDKAVTRGNERLRPDSKVTLGGKPPANSTDTRQQKAPATHSPPKTASGS